LKDAQAQIKGIADYAMAEGIKDVETHKRAFGDYADWTALRAHWQQVINALGAGFINGDARVAPKNINACRYCHFDALCRIERHSEDEDSEGENPSLEERW
jgi:hypothetical protein